MVLGIEAKALHVVNVVHSSATPAWPGPVSSVSPRKFCQVAFPFLFRIFKIISSLALQLFRSVLLNFYISVDSETDFMSCGWKEYGR